MYAFIGFFYVFVSAYIYKIMTTDDTKPIKIYIDTDIVNENDKYDSHGDCIMSDGGSEGEDDDYVRDEKNYFYDIYKNNVYHDGVSSDKLLVNMTVASEHVRVLQDVHDYMKEDLLVELDLSVDLSDEKTITWSFEYEVDYETDIKREMVGFVHEHVLTHNVVIYYDGERLDETTVLAL
jgi:hypothetical protein